MDFTTFDLIIMGLILFLSLKGMVNGFTKELFNFIGLVGGVAVASRINTPVGEFINTSIYPITNQPALELVGFVAALLIVWIVFSFVASIFDRFTAYEPNFFSRLLGYVMTAARYVAIFALIIVGIQKSQFLQEKMAQYYENSLLFPILSEIGTQLLNTEARATPQTQPNNKEEPVSLNFKTDANASQE
ncbi:MAG TPA: CvpA family protein [Campylobacterales bacterium]|nr:CvpA family protein [Campylobacterales bacterium]